MIHIKFIVKHIPNMIVRVFTNDAYYVCEECHKIHKRDGNEIRLTDDMEHLLLHRIWYGSVSRECFIKQQNEVRKILYEAIFK